MSADRVHSQPGNEGIVREFKSSPFFTEKSGNYQGVLIECQGNKGGISKKTFFNDKFSVCFIFSYVHVHVLKCFPTFSCYEYYVKEWIFVFKDINVQHACLLNELLNEVNELLINVTNLHRY